MYVRIHYRVDMFARVANVYFGSKSDSNLDSQEVD